MAFEVDNLFQAIDIILEQRLQDVRFDKTIICTIVDDSDKKNGCYVVSDGTIKFKAYVNDATYRNNDQVRVSVLGGDFSEKKFITGRYTGDEDSSPITYKSPLEDIIPITGNLVKETNNSKNGVNGLKANGDIIQQDIWRIDLTSNSEFRDLQSNGIYNTLTIKADFKTLLSHYDLVSGNYGLRLDLLIQPSLDNPTQRIRKYVTLDSSEMLGNPYSFSVYSTQAKKVDIVSTGIIAEMVLWIYQSINGDGEGRRFIERNGNEIPVNQKLDDILIKNIEIGFGSNVEKIEDNTLQIFTSSPPYYIYNNQSAATNKKDIELLWFNKTDNNEFIGFKDGLFDLAYDEIDYLKKSNLDARLVAQIGRTDVPSDEPGLKLAADLKDAKPIMIKARDALTNEVADVLYRLQRQVKSSASILEKLNVLLNTANGNLVTQWDLADAAIENWDKSYIEALQYAYNKQNNIENTSEWVWDIDYYKEYVAAINSGVKFVNDFFNWFDEVTQPAAAQSAHRGNYDLYKYKVDKELGKITTWLNQIDSLLKGNFEKLQAYKDEEYKFYEYKQKDLSSYHNKYCIYWYRHDKDYKLEYVEDGDNDEYNYGKFLTDGWRRVEIIQDEKQLIPATLLPVDISKYKIKTGSSKIYYPIIELTNLIESETLDKVFQAYKEEIEGYFPLTIYPNFGLPRNEKLCVNENGEPYYDDKGKPINSNLKKYYPAKALAQVASRMMNRNLLEEKYMVILFHNHEMYKSNVLVFTNSEPESIPNDLLVDQRDALKIEHDVASQEHYQAYNEFNQLKSLEDGGKVRQLKCIYDGLFKGDEALINAGLYWYIPNHSTMLTFDTDFLIKEGFATDAEEITEHSIDGYTYFYKKIGKCSDDERLTDKDGNLYYTCNNADRYFFYKIKPALEKTATNNTILVKAYLENSEDPVEGDITMTFSTFGTNGTKYTLTIVPATSQAAVIGKDKPLELQILLKDSQNNTIDIVTSSKVSEANAYGFMVENWNNLPNAFTVGNIYGEAKEDDTEIVKGLTVALTKANINSWKEKQPYFGIINAKVNFRLENNIDEDENNPNKKVDQYQKYRVVDLNTLYAIPYSSSNAYYMSGATNIVYNNQGTVSYVSEDEYVLYTVNDKGNEPVENQIWSMKYYDKNGDEIKPDDNDWPIVINYMPVLNGKNRLTPAPLYIDNLDYIPVVVCEVNGDIAWVQPIIITQNRYASSTLNDWNGSLTIDEKNGTILTTAVGAGKKEPNNSFSGVLMGDIGKGMNFDTDNMSGLGLYGFNQGAQSFCLSVDGKAFFGKAGRGRIYIDGDSGTISSASYQSQRTWDEATKSYLHPSAAGMMIDLDDGFIHMLGATYANKTYSPDKPEGKDSQAEVLISTGLVNNQAAPYFKIRSKAQTNKDHYLMYVDTENYYLQTDDYVAWTYNKNDDSGTQNFTGKGLKLDLKNGKLDAYNFQLSSKNVYIDSTDSSEGFFIIKDNTGSNLFFTGSQDYYLKSSDYQSMNPSAGILGTGMKLTLMTTSGDTGIEAYNFDLRAGDTGYGTHRIIISDSGNPYFRVNTVYDSNNKTIVNISETEQYFQSSDYDLSKKQGIRLSLSDKELKAYSGFTLQALRGSAYAADAGIYLDSTASSYPFKIIGNTEDQNYFKVDWDGTVSAQGGTFNNINAVGGTFSGSISVAGTLTGGTITGASIYAANLYAGGNGTIGGSYILKATTSGVTINGAEITGGGSGGNSYGLSSSGNMNATGADLTTLTVRGTAHFTDTCMTTIDGYLGINTSPSSAFDLSLGGSAIINGGLQIQGSSANGFALYATGDIMFYSVGIGIEPTTANLTVGSNGIDCRGLLKVVSPNSGIECYGPLKAYNNGSLDTIRKLAFYDKIVISNSTFKLGSSEAYNIIPSLSGDTATFYVSIPGQSYSAGYSQTRYIHVSDPNATVQVTTSSSPPAGYYYKQSITLGGSGSGTTDTRGATISITFAPEVDS